MIFLGLFRHLLSACKERVNDSLIIAYGSFWIHRVNSRHGSRAKFWKWHNQVIFLSFQDCILELVVMEHIHADANLDDQLNLRWCHCDFLPACVQLYSSWFRSTVPLMLIIRFINHSEHRPYSRGLSVYLSQDDYIQLSAQLNLLCPPQLGLLASRDDGLWQDKPSLLRLPASLLRAEKKSEGLDLAEGRFWIWILWMAMDCMNLSSGDLTKKNTIRMEQPKKETTKYSYIMLYLYI